MRGLVNRKYESFCMETQIESWFDSISNFRYSYPLALTTQTSGVYLTVLVSVHRFLGVCYPFKAKRWVTRRPVQYAIIGSVVFSVLVNVPTWLELSVVPCFSERFNRVSRLVLHINHFINGNKKGCKVSGKFYLLMLQF